MLSFDLQFKPRKWEGYRLPSMLRLMMLMMTKMMMMMLMMMMMRMMFKLRRWEGYRLPSMLRLIMMTLIYRQKIILFLILQLSDVIDRQQNLERTNLKLREGTDEVVWSTLIPIFFQTT